ncbi:hypothetical protein Hanom_Chr11g01020561 [Helianthus anomalus]
MRPVWVDESRMQVGCHKCPVNFSEKVGGYGSHRAIRGIWAEKLSASVPKIRAYGPMSGILVCFFFKACICWLQMSDIFSSLLAKKIYTIFTITNSQWLFANVVGRLH